MQCHVSLDSTSLLIHVSNTFQQWATDNYSIPILGLLRNIMFSIEHLTLTKQAPASADWQ